MQGTGQWTHTFTDFVQYDLKRAEKERGWEKVKEGLRLRIIIELEEAQQRSKEGFNEDVWREHKLIIHM